MVTGTVSVSMHSGQSRVESQSLYTDNIAASHSLSQSLDLYPSLNLVHKKETPLFVLSNISIKQIICKIFRSKNKNKQLLQIKKKKKQKNLHTQNTGVMYLKAIY